MMDQFMHLLKQGAQQQTQEIRPFVFGHIANVDPTTSRIRAVLPTLRGDDGTPVLTPWMKLGTIFSGNGYGFQVAPKGGASLENPTAGEQVLVSIVDSGSGVTLSAVMTFSDAQPPPFPDLVGGECGLMADGGSFVKLKADKSITIDTSTGNGNVIVNAGTGKTTVNADEVDVVAATKVKVTAPDIELGRSGGVVQPVKLADNSASVVLKAM